MYSAVKNKAKRPEAYSVLKPDSNSDSPSVKLNGARLVSAKIEINLIIARGQVGRNNCKFFWVTIRVISVNDPFRRRTERRMMAKVTSYEVVWDTACNAPINAYLELDVHPDNKIACMAKAWGC